GNETGGGPSKRQPASRRHCGLRLTLARTSRGWIQCQASGRTRSTCSPNSATHPLRSPNSPTGASSDSRRHNQSEDSPIMKLDPANTYPEKLIEQMKDMGIFGLAIPEPYGFVQVSTPCYALVTEELARG